MVTKRVTTRRKVVEAPPAPSVKSFPTAALGLGMGSPIKLVASILLLLTVVVSSEETANGLKKDEAWVCVRWQWTTTPFEGKVNCVAWAKKDCSNRLYPEICKKGG